MLTKCSSVGFSGIGLSAIKCFVEHYISMLHNAHNIDGDHVFFSAPAHVQFVMQFISSSLAPVGKLRKFPVQLEPFRLYYLFRLSLMQALVCFT